MGVLTPTSCFPTSVERPMNAALELPLEEPAEPDPVEAAAEPAPEDVPPELVQLLDHRYGDGLVYLREAAERTLYRQAMRLGLISSEGYLTPEGFAVIARHGAG